MTPQFQTQLESVFEESIRIGNGFEESIGIEIDFEELIAGLASF